MIERGDKFCSRCLTQSRSGSGGCRMGATDPPDAAPLFAPLPFGLCAGRFGGHITRMLDILAIKIGHIKPAVRSGGQKYGMKPGIGRC